MKPPRFMVGTYNYRTGAFAWEIGTNRRIIAWLHEQRIGLREIWLMRGLQSAVAQVTE